MEKPTQRLIILGDPHIYESEIKFWEEEIIADINGLNPDLVLVLGDLTGGSGMGESEKTRQAVQALSGLNAPWYSIIGNHDLQAPEFETDEASVQAMLSVLGRDTPWFSLEQESFAIIGLSNTFWRRNTVNKNEIVLDDTQLEWWRKELKRLHPKPVLILGHAPPIGTGLMVLPELHARVGNAYMNQNHVPSCIQQIIWEHPNIVFWFSGHNHLGQHYRDAISKRLGVCYVHTGTASPSHSRDGFRHSRILDMGPATLRIQTFDHDLRCIDQELEHTIQNNLNTLVRKRIRMAEKRFVPADPETMEQDAGSARQRFVFLSDAHSVAPLVPIQKRIAAWCVRQIRALSPDTIILGGDITHRAIPAQAEVFLDALKGAHTPMEYLPGNNEGEKFLLTVQGCVALEDAVFLLATSNTEEAGRNVDALLQQLPASGSCLVFAHFPPQLAGETRMQALAQSNAKIHWICGHKHEALAFTDGNLEVTICAGLDPIKVRRSEPELLVCDWDQSTLSLQRIRVPQKYISPASGPEQRIGVAFRGTAETLLSTAIEYKIPAIQFHYRHSQGRATDTEKQLAQEYRQTISDAFLSLHLPNFPRPAEGVDLADQAAWLQWAEDMQLDDLTVHLPDVPTHFLYHQDGTFQSTDWVERCLETYSNLARRALKMGAQISFENVYNKKISPPGEERLSTLPWHLLRFVEAIRERSNVSKDQQKKIGIIFDSGHAFADVHIAKHHGLADWLSQVAPYLQLAHIHQVTPRAEGGGTQNHQTILKKEGPLVNFDGLLAAFRDVSKKTFPLLIEVREQENALQSWKTLGAHLQNPQI